jgi:hypothetical protein
MLNVIHLQNIGAEHAVQGYSTAAHIRPWVGFPAL